MLGAILLAGGQNRRMGTNKAFLRFQPDEPYFIEIILATLSRLTPHITIVTNQPELYQRFGYPTVPDKILGAGPLAGLEAGLTASKAIWNVLVACDMPYIKYDLLAYLGSQVGDDYAAIVPLNEAGKPEPLCAVYNQVCLNVIRQNLAAGQLKMTDFLAKIPKSRLISAVELKPFDPNLDSFRNFNWPSDLR